MVKNYYYAVSNDELNFVVSPIFKTCKELSKFFDIPVGTICSCIFRKNVFTKLNVKFVKCDMSKDLKSNTYEDFIEFCKFEKIDPYRITSLLKYRKSIDEEIANAYLYGEI